MRSLEVEVRPGSWYASGRVLVRGRGRAATARERRTGRIEINWQAQISQESTSFFARAQGIYRSSSRQPRCGDATETCLNSFCVPCSARHRLAAMADYNRGMIRRAQISLARLLACVGCACLAMGFLSWFGRSVNPLVWLPALVFAGASIGAAVGTLLGATEKGALLGGFFALPTFLFFVMPFVQRI